jgi:glycine reductase
MLLDKLNGRPFDTEVSMPSYDRITPAPGIKDVCKAVIALITDGGLVPNGNPDNIEIKAATRFGKYSIEGMASLSPDAFEVSHAGYDSVYVRQDPNRLVPVDILREMEQSGAIGKLHEEFYSTAGVANIVDTVVKMGKMMAEDLKASSVSGVILTST